MLGAMRMLGLSEFAWWFSFVLQAASVLFWTALFIIWTAYACGLTLFDHTDFSVLLCTFWLFGMANMLFGCVLASLTSSTRLMNVLCFLLFIAGVIVTIIVGQLGAIDLSGDDDEPQTNTLINAILNPVTLPRGFLGLIQLFFPPLGLCIVISDLLVVVRSVATISEEGQVKGRPTRQALTLPFSSLFFTLRPSPFALPRFPSLPTAPSAGTTSSLATTRATQTRQCTHAKTTGRTLCPSALPTSTAGGTQQRPAP